MTAELLLANDVRAWCERTFPGDERAADRGVAVALSAFAAGASVAEACEQSRAFAGSWARHPSRGCRATPGPFPDPSGRRSFIRLAS